MIKVTFDSNVWRLVASPHTFPNEPLISCFGKLHEAVRTGGIAAHIAVVAFTLEAIKKRDRQSFMRSYEAKIEGEIDNDKSSLPEGMIGLTFSIGPNIKAHPGNNPHLYKHLADALAIGFRLLGCPRVGGIANPDIAESYFVRESAEELRERLDLFSDCADVIEKLGGGIAHAIRVGEHYASSGEPWHMGIKRSPPTAADEIAKALAEWADGDAIAAHVGYKNDYFCTRDVGKSAGTSSVLSLQNRDALTSKFGVKFITPRSLCDLIAK